MLKKAASGVLAILPCSRTPCTLRASKWLRPCWTDFFEHSLQLMMAVSSWAGICHGSEIFNSPRQGIVGVPKGKLVCGTVVMRNRYGFDKLTLLVQNLVL